MEEKKTISKVIPEGEQNCIWADAGLVSYKLCDRNFECDECPFDQVMRQKSIPASASVSTAKSTSDVTGAKVRVKQDSLLDVIRGIFGGPFSVKPPSDRMYSHAHVWLKKTAANNYQVGIDHFAAGLLEGVGSVVLPQTGTSTLKDNPCAWMTCEEGTIAIQSPVDGKIKSVNHKVMESVAIFRQDPYGAGWICEISCLDENAATCVDALTIEVLSKEQFKSLKQNLLTEFDARPPSLGVTMMDGGIRPRTLKDLLGTSRYVSFLQVLFSGRK
jgi:glycine cleavage system H protein